MINDLQDAFALGCRRAVIERRSPVEYDQRQPIHHAAHDIGEITVADCRRHQKHKPRNTEQKPETVRQGVRKFFDRQFFQFSSDHGFIITDFAIIAGEINVIVL